MFDAENLAESHDTNPLEHRILAVLIAFDPYGLKPGAPGGFPFDEYLPEAQSLATLLTQKGALTFTDVSDVWMAWFDDDLSDLPPGTAEWLVASVNACVSVDETH
jgi:hypothetical protein